MPGWERVQSGVPVRARVAENERIDGEPRTPGSTAGQRSRSVSSLKSFVHVHVAMKVNFALEQPSSTGVDQVHARVTVKLSYSVAKLTHKDTYVYGNALRRSTNTRSDDLEC